MLERRQETWSLSFVSIGPTATEQSIKNTMPLETTKANSRWIRVSRLGRTVVVCLLVMLLIHDTFKIRQSIPSVPKVTQQSNSPTIRLTTATNATSHSQSNHTNETNDHNTRIERFLIHNKTEDQPPRNTLDLQTKPDPKIQTRPESQSRNDSNQETTSVSKTNNTAPPPSTWLYSHMLPHCPALPPDLPNRAAVRWVQVENFTVTKIHAFRHDYMHEKQVSQMLSNYSNFVTLLDYDDDCFKLKFERLFPAEGFPRTLGGINNDTWTNIETQIHSIFEVFSTKQIQSSHEYLMGLNNIYIGSRGNVTMFDFHEYRYQNDTRMGGKPSGFQYNHTLETEHKHRLLAILREKRKTSKHQPKPKP